MTIMMKSNLRDRGFLVMGQAEKSIENLAGLRGRQRPSLYADPLSWLIFDVVENVTSQQEGSFLAAKEGVGHIVVSEACTSFTMAELSTAIDLGHLSPLRFSGANPGLVCTLPSQLLGFCGPSLVFSMAPSKGADPALDIARSWLRSGRASHVFISCHQRELDDQHVVSTVLIRIKA